MASCLVFVFVTLAALICISATAADIPLQEWEDFKLQHGKQYKSKTEETIRLRNFLINKSKIDKHNRLAQQGIYRFEMGLNQFADQLHDEFLDTMDLNRKFVTKNNEQGSHSSSQQSEISSSDAVDWRDQGCVRPAFDLGISNATWPFVATGALEGQWCVAHQTFLPISEQNLLDCITGVEIPQPTDAYEYCVDNGGVDTEDSYPFTGIPSDCKYNPDNKGVLCNAVVNVPCGNETALEESVLTRGPVSVAIDASQMSFQFYTNGVYHDDQCSAEILDHLLLVVGFNQTADGQQFWIARNSWGTNWGIDGYVWIARNSNNMCGIATDASFPSTNYCSKAGSECNRKF